MLRFDQQSIPKVLRTIVDTDHGGDRLTRRSTTGMVRRWGTHTTTKASNLQTPIGLSVSEAEKYALVHGSCHALGIQSYLRGLGIGVGITLESDSNAA